MKKFSKFVFATLSVAAFVGGAYYFVKNILNKDAADDFDDFDDDFDDCDFEEEEDCQASKEDRGYVTLNFQEEDAVDTSEAAIPAEDTASVKEDETENPAEDDETPAAEK